MTTIEVRGLTKTFGEVTVVDRVSFDVPAGSVTGFVGVNGSGKTTTMRMMLGLLPATEGSTRYDGRTYGELDVPRAVVGAVVNRLGAHPRHSARRHLELIALASGLPVERVDVALGEVGLGDVADQRLGRYSMGMQQRCALAAAMLGDPSVLVLDEPANGLDPAGIRWLRGRLRSWADEGRAVFVASHQLAELAAVVDRLVVLDQGRVRFEGAASELGAGGASLEDAVFELLADAASPGAQSVAP